MTPVQSPRSPARLAYAFYGVAAAGAVIGQVWVALERIPWDAAWPMWLRLGAVLPFALCLELLAMVLAAMADERQRLGEPAYGFRLFSGVVAVLAVGIIVAGHWPHAYQVAAFGALSGAAYALWLLHSAARRRDALRAAGLLEPAAPAYGVWRRLRHPVLTARAAEFARERGLSVHESMRMAERALRVEARRPALAAAVERAVRADHDDPLRADIEARTLDLDAIAAELEARADYAWWADRLAPVRTQPADTAQDGSRRVADMSAVAVSASPAAKAGQRRGRKSGKADKPRGSVADRIAQTLEQNPDMSRAELARRVRTSDRHVRRVLSAMSGPAGAGEPDPTADIGSDVQADLTGRTNGHASA